MKYDLEAACHCHVGRIRSNNEDNFYFDDRILMQENRGLKKAISIRVSCTERFATFGIFDGMGGEEDGQVASYLAADSYREKCHMLEYYVVPPKEFLQAGISNMNDTVCRTAESNLNRMGTTATLLYFCEDEIYVCNVGDSKGFRLRTNELLQISEDHTDAKLLAAHGIKNRNPHLTQYIGIAIEEMLLEPHVEKGQVLPGDQYLICSDGLTDMLSNIEICSILQESISAKESAEKLVSAAVESGGRDNISVIVVRVVQHGGE